MNTIDIVNNLKENECIVDVLFKAVSSHKCKDCGKCVFGYEGITQLEMILKDITEKRGRSTDVELLQDLCGMMKTQSLCEDGVEVAEGVLAALDTYKKDFEDHASRRGCRAGVCERFLTYHILADKCGGCGECIDACEDGAILGKKRFIHVIDQNECMQCGACVAACDCGAIIRAGAVKPKGPKRPIPCKRR